MSPGWMKTAHTIIAGRALIFDMPLERAHFRVEPLLIVVAFSSPISPSVSW